MIAEQHPEEQKGEGSYEGAREYQRRTGKFLDEHGDEVERMAHDAADALDSEDSDELRRAEAAGKAPARK